MKTFKIHLKDRIQNADVYFCRQGKDLEHVLPSIKREILRLKTSFGGNWYADDISEVCGKQ